MTKKEFEIARSYLPRYMEILELLGIEPLFRESDIVQRYSRFPKSARVESSFYGLKSTTILDRQPTSGPLVWLAGHVLGAPDQRISTVPSAM